MQVAVLAARESWYVRDLRRAAGTRHELTVVSFSELASTLSDGPLSVSSRGVDLGRCEAVLVRTMPPGSLEQVVFRMDAIAGLERVGTTVINPPRAIEAAVDKYLASSRLQAAGLLTPTTIVCQTVDEAMDGFRSLGERAVLKPLFGGEGRGITLLEDEALALRAFKMLAQMSAVIYLQQFIPHHGCDLRLLVIGRQVLGMRRRHPDDWRTNISRGGIAEPLEVDQPLRDIALRGADAVGAPLAGVDVLPGQDGLLYTIEVNAVPGWRAMSRTLQVDVAARVLELLETKRITAIDS